MPIKFQRTYDLNLVRSILTHPKLYKWRTSDFHPAVEDFQPNPDPSIHYMVAYDDEILGLFTAHPIHTPLTWEIHHAILPEHLDKTAAIAEAFELWLFTETPCLTIVGFTPARNRLACKYAERCGMKEIGRLPRAYKKYGVLCDLLIYAKSKM